MGITFQVAPLGWAPVLLLLLESLAMEKRFDLLDLFISDKGESSITLV
jgi:hypothetical protein